MSSQIPNSGFMFAGLPNAPSKRWKYFGYSLLAEAVLLAILVQLGLVEPGKIIHKQTSYVITLAPPPPVPQTIQKVPAALLHAPKPIIHEAPKLAENEIPKIEPPKIEPPKLETKIEPPKPKVADKPVFETATVAKSEPKPGPIVKTGSFNSSGSSATPTTNLAASKVQTGGFGDPNGIAAKNTSNGPSNIAHVGGFDLPQGEGHGNGTGGAKGVPGVVVSAGFGNGVAASGGGGHGNGGVVRSTGFDQAPATVASRPREVTQPNFTSAEVLSKPTPTYTAEARALKLEGEVLLEVVFSASGKIQVVRVVRGLGHGLDEAAIRAAQQIKFKPATRGGTPIDSTATLHIVFQLA